MRRDLPRRASRTIERWRRVPPERILRAQYRRHDRARDPRSRYVVCDVAAAGGGAGGRTSRGCRAARLLHSRCALLGHRRARPRDVPRLRRAARRAARRSAAAAHGRQGRVPARRTRLAWSISAATASVRERRLAARSRRQRRAPQRAGRRLRALDDPSPMPCVSGPTPRKPSREHPVRDSRRRLAISTPSACAWT